jgi:hypothetical protein
VIRLDQWRRRILITPLPMADVPPEVHGALSQLCRVVNGNGDLYSRMRKAQKHAARAGRYLKARGGVA